MDYDTFGDRHTYNQITGNGLISTHDPKGNTLYGLDIFVDPDYRGLRLGRRLYNARKELSDHVLGFQLANDFHVRRILKGYLKGDAASREYATLLEWSNVDYEEPHANPTVNRGIVRVGIVQWQMRSVKSVEDFVVVSG